VDWIEVIQNKVKLRAIVYTVMNPWFP